MQLVSDLISGLTVAASTGSASAGQLVIGTSALSGSTGVLATIPLSAPAATIAGSILTISGVPLTGLASAAGTPAVAELRNNAGTTIISGLTVGTTSSDIIITSATISLGGSVVVTSGTITHA